MEVGVGLLEVKQVRPARLKSPLMSNSEMRARASVSLRPSCVIADAVRSAMPIPADPAPRNRIRWSESFPPVIQGRSSTRRW